jgi:hypothetical protein
MTRFLHRVVLAVTVAALAGCRPAGVPTEYLLFLDLSGSVSSAQREAWLTSGDAALKRLSFGDSLAIFPIHDRTLDAAPLFRARVPEKGYSLEEIAGAKAALLQVRSEAGAALRDALEGNTRSRGTQLFEVIDKLASSPSGEPKVLRKVFIFSDFLQSSRDLDFERTRLADQDLAALIASLQNRHGWTNDTLRGVTIYGILTGADSGERRPINDRRVLKQFWGMLFHQLGAELASFDTYLNLKGVHHAASIR